MKPYHIFVLILAAIIIIYGFRYTPDLEQTVDDAISPAEQKVDPGENETADSVHDTSLPESYDVITSVFGDLDEMHERRIIRILTVYSVGRYYIDGAQEKGIVRETSTLFENFLNKRFKRKHDRFHVVIVPVARHQLIPALREGRGDIIAASLSITREREALVDFSDPVTKPLSEILVTGPKAPPINTLEDLSGKTIYVRRSSSYRESVEALNTQLGAAGKEHIRVEYISELLEDDDLIEMVSGGLLEWAIVDDYKLPWWQDVFDNITPRRDIVFRKGGRIAWAFRKDSPQLAEAINEFFLQHREGTMIGNVLKNRYFRDFDWAANALASEDFRRFEELRDIFEKYGERFGIEYLMLAAQGYQESRLKQNARSRSGAVGVMQIKPSTAADPNVNVKNIYKVDPNIHAGVKYLDFIRGRYFNDQDIDENNQILLSLAAYNIGPGRMIKLREQAKALGYDPNVWFDNVELAAAKYIGREPVQYVANIFKYYLAYRLSGEQLLSREQARDEAGIKRG